MLQTGAMSSTGGERQGCLQSAGLSGCDWHKNLAQLACSPPAVSTDHSCRVALGSTLGVRTPALCLLPGAGELRRERVCSPAPVAELVALGRCADSRSWAPAS